MNDKPLSNLRIAILATDGFEQAELFEPKKAVEEAGAQTFVIAPHTGEIQGMQHDEKGEKVTVDMLLEEADPANFDGVILPGGALNADHLRMDLNAQEFVKIIDAERKPIAVICHGPWLLVSSGLVQGRRLTSYYTIQDDVRNAGGYWHDAEVFRDENWVSSRQPSDLPAFTSEMVKLFQENSQFPHILSPDA